MWLSSVVTGIAMGVSWSFSQFVRSWLLSSLGATEIPAFAFFEFSQSACERELLWDAKVNELGW